MPSVAFNTGFTSWTPSASGVPNGVTLTFRAIGSGGDGEAGDAILNGGSGGGGGEFAEDYYFVSDNTESFSIQVAAGGSTDITYVETPAPAYLVIANPGGNAMMSPGSGGSGGTGAITRSGGSGGTGSGVDGGGGGGGAGDSASGNNGSGTSGGAGVTQFGSTGAGAGGAAGSNSGNGNIGQLHGGGGGGGGITGSGAGGANGRIEASYTAATGADQQAWWWFFFASLFGSCAAHWPKFGDLSPLAIMRAGRHRFDSPLLYGTRREWRRLFEQPRLILPSQRLLIGGAHGLPVTQR